MLKRQPHQHGENNLIWAFTDPLYIGLWNLLDMRMGGWMREMKANVGDLGDRLIVSCGTAPFVEDLFADDSAVG